LVPIRFLVDTGADVTSLPQRLAEQEGIPFSRSEAGRGLSGSLLGTAVRYRGTIVVRIGSEEFDWPCDFLQVPIPSSSRPEAVLGRAGFLADFSLCLDDEYLMIERRARSWWTRLRRYLWPSFTPTLRPRDPL
jgi:hypothetical protein